MIDPTLTDLTHRPPRRPRDARRAGRSSVPRAHRARQPGVPARRRPRLLRPRGVGGPAVVAGPDRLPRLGYLAYRGEKLVGAVNDHDPDGAGRHDARVRRVPAPRSLGRGHRRRAARHRGARRRGARSLDRADVDAAPRRRGRREAQRSDGLRGHSRATTGRPSSSFAAATRSSRPSATACSTCAGRSRRSIAFSPRRARRPAPTTAW